jgi:hypothetical protein
MGEDVAQLESVFESYKRSVPKNYIKLLKALQSSRIDQTDFRWAAPNDKQEKEFTLYSSRINATIDAIENMVEEEVNIVTITGQLTGTYKERRFEITVDDGKRYEGKIDTNALSVEAFELINNARISGRYTVTIRDRATRRVALDKIRHRYTLIDFKEPGSNSTTT